MTSSLPVGAPLPEWIPFGYVSRAHGVKGELRLEAFAAGDGLPEGCKRLRLVSPAGAARLFDLAAVRPVHDATLITLAGVADRDAAAALRGQRVELERTSLPPAPPGEHYSFELLGAALLDEDQQHLGTVRGVMDNGGQELLRVETPLGERLLALGPGVFLRFERDAGRLWVRRSAGLVLAAGGEGG